MEIYKKIGWVDQIIDAETGQILQEGTPLSQTNLNHMDVGIYEAHEELKRTMKNDESIFLAEGIHYGEELPEPGIPGRVFLLKL